MSESEITAYVWAWKFLIFFVINPWAMVLLWIAAIGCISHFIYITFYEAKKNEAD